MPEVKKLEIKPITLDYFMVGEFYLSGKGKRLKVVDKLPDKGMVLFESVEPVTNSGNKVNGHRMGLKLPQCRNFSLVNIH